MNFLVSAAKGRCGSALPGAGQEGSWHGERRGGELGLEVSHPTFSENLVKSPVVYK